VFACFHCYICTCSSIHCCVFPAYFSVFIAWLFCSTKGNCSWLLAISREAASTRTQFIRANKGSFATLAEPSAADSKSFVLILFPCLLLTVCDTFFLFSFHSYSGTCEATHCVCDKGWIGDYCDTTTIVGPSSGAAPAARHPTIYTAVTLTAALWVLQSVL